jgi:hypothetical protein
MVRVPTDYFHGTPTQVLGRDVRRAKQLLAHKLHPPPQAGGGGHSDGEWTNKHAPACWKLPARSLNGTRSAGPTSRTSVN